MKRVIANAIVWGAIGGIILYVIKLFIGGFLDIEFETLNWLPFGSMGIGVLLGGSWERDKNYDKYEMINRVRLV